MAAPEEMSREELILLARTHAEAIAAADERVAAVEGSGCGASTHRAAEHPRPSNGDHNQAPSTAPTTHRHRRQGNLPNHPTKPKPHNSLALAT